jgi:hypothetical protein
LVGLCALWHIAIVGHAAGTHLRARALDRRRHGAEYPLRAPLCAGFADGAFNSNDCPPGFSKIATEAACVSTAKAVGRPYSGRMVTGLTSWPSGCFTVSSVYFNADPTGGTNATARPLCAGA